MLLQFKYDAKQSKRHKPYVKLSVSNILTWAFDGARNGLLIELLNNRRAFLKTLMRPQKRKGKHRDEVIY